MPKTVITYGTFDLFHIGHIKLLQGLKSLRDKLIVSMVSYYYSFEKLVFTIKSFFYIINQTFFPKLSKVYTENKDKYFTIWKKLSIYTISSSVAVYIVLYSIANLFIKYYYGESLLEHMYIFYVLSFTIILYAIINALELNGLLVIEKYKQLSISQIIPAIILILFSPFVLKLFGFTVFLFFIVLADLIIILIRLYFLKRIFYGKS